MDDIDFIERLTSCLLRVPTEQLFSCRIDKYNAPRQVRSDNGIRKTLEGLIEAVFLSLPALFFAVTSSGDFDTGM